MELISLNTKGENKGHYSPGVIHGGTLYISGQLSIDLDTREVPGGSVEEHMRLALHNLERVLTAASLRRNDVVSCRIYITDINDWDRVNEVYKEFFGGHKPARAVIPVAGGLHFGCLVEIEAIAACK
ncbi:MAG: RidA family protein [Oscillospiraceae bacterium]|nr:RidA family protein [Oscillospiraceae bacterium]